MVVRLSEAGPYIIEALSITGTYIENVPICILPKFKDRISDLKKPEDNLNYYNREKTKPDKCFDCRYFNECDGMWKAYLEQFGDEEMIPQ